MTCILCLAGLQHKVSFCTVLCSFHAWIFDRLNRRCQIWRPGWHEIALQVLSRGSKAWPKSLQASIINRLHCPQEAIQAGNT